MRRQRKDTETQEETRFAASTKVTATSEERHSGKPAGNQRETIRKPAGSHQETSGKPSRNHQGTSEKPLGDDQETIRKPAGNHQETSGKPSGNQRETIQKPSGNQRETIRRRSGNHQETRDAFSASTIVTATPEESHRDTRGDMWKRENEVLLVSCWLPVDDFLT